MFQLLSPSLPVGAFAYSQGLEWAAETGWVNSEQALANWLSDQLSQALTYVDLPILLRMIEAAMADDAQLMSHWISELRALRETPELRAEEVGRGRALADLLGALGLFGEQPSRQSRGAQLGASDLVPSPLPQASDAHQRQGDERRDAVSRTDARRVRTRQISAHDGTAAVETAASVSGQSRGQGLNAEQSSHWRALLSGSQLAGFAFASAAWQLEPADTLLGYAWSWAENLTLAGVKLIPLGQTAGQRILLQLAEQIPAAVERARRLDDADIGASMPALSIASSRHETQYTRLYRS
ncbi:MAG: urease accessory protein UreF [Chromatiaceae bacterium]|nr:urease accessory protein UreF [Chromatiaceae bacterium]